MARLLAGLALLLATLFAPGAWAQSAPPPILLQDQPGHIDLPDAIHAWVDAGGKATIEDVTRGRGADFQPAAPDASYRLGATSALWLHLRLQRGARERQDWVLELPMPVLDHVTVYQSEGGGWRAGMAGDQLPVNRWVEPGRYPSFRLDVGPGQVRDVYVRIRHATASNFPIVLHSVAAHGHHQQIEYLALGTAFGALLLLIFACLARAIVYRDAVFGWYAGYAALTGLAVSAYTGVAAHLLWSGLGLAGDAVMPVLACAAVAAAMLFVRNILGLRRLYPRVDRAVFWLAIAGFVVAPLTAMLPKPMMAVLASACIVAGTLVAVLLAVVSWLRGDAVARWVLAAYVPMGTAVVLGVLRVFGLVPLTVGSQYAVVIAMTVEVPLLLVALFIRSRDRHSAEIREQALSTHDALTGLLAPHLFHDRLRQVVARYRRGGEKAAVMYIDLVNHGRIHQVFGTAVAEQSLLRSVIKLRRLLRDVDTVSRVGEARFGVILEGASSRSSVTERASRLIAAGLMPLPGLKPDVTLQFHVAALMLDERPMEADEIEQVLRERLARMSTRTRRPIRFVDAGTPPSSEPEPESLFAPDADAEGPSSGLATLR